MTNLCKETNAANIVYLNLFNNKIKKIQGLQNCVGLKTLILSFNEIQELDGLKNCGNLIKVDLQNNFIKAVKNLENNKKITFLDLSQNLICDLAHINYIRETLTNLKEFSVKCNPVSAKKEFREDSYSKTS